MYTKNCNVQRWKTLAKPAIPMITMSARYADTPTREMHPRNGPVCGALIEIRANLLFDF